MATRPGRPSVPPHRLDPDPAVPADPYRRIAVCARCGKPGRVGDAQHPLDVPAVGPGLPPALAASARAFDAAVLGERLEEEEEA